MLREPRLVEMSPFHPFGDFTCFLWVMEPEKGRIFGKAFKISATELAVGANVGAIKKAAYDEMIARSERGDAADLKPEGSFWEAFL